MQGAACVPDAHSKVGKQDANSGSTLSQITAGAEGDSDDGEVDGSNVKRIEACIADTKTFKWDSAEWELIRSLQDAVRNYGRVEMMRRRTRDWGFVAVKRMPTKWVTSGPREFQSTYPRSSERPWVDIGMLRYLNLVRFPYVCHFYGVFQDPECSCVVMSYADAGDLFGWCDQLRAQGGAREAAVRPVARQFMSAVAWLHTLGIAHRDLSLENILLDGQGQGPGGPKVKLIDFGMSTLSRWVASEVRGKQSYQAPEMHLDERYDTFLSDTFALGVVVFCLLSQDYPWQATIAGKCQLFDFVRMRGLRGFCERRKHPKGNGAKLAQVFSEPLMEFLEALLEFDPSRRHVLGEVCFCSENRRTVWDMAWFDDWAESDVAG